MQWLFSWLSGGMLDVIMKSVVQPFLNVWLKSKDVDLEKHRIDSTNTTNLAVAILDANVKFASVKAQYAIQVLQWWPFRLILFVLLAVVTVRFGLVVFDSTWWWIFGCKLDGVRTMGDACSWSIPALKGSLAGVEVELLLFFIIAKPAEMAVGGALGMVSKYLEKKS